MYDLSDDRNCKETGIFASAFAAGSFCAMIVYGISIVCMRKGITAPVNLNILSIGTGALLGFQELLCCMRQRCFFIAVINVM